MLPKMKQIPWGYSFLWLWPGRKFDPITERIEVRRQAADPITRKDAPSPWHFLSGGKGALIFLGVKTPFLHLFVYTIFIAASTRRCGTQLLRPFRFSLTPVIEPLLHCWWSARETICKTSLSANQVPNWKATFLNKIERSTRLTWFRGRYCHCRNTY